MLTRQEIEEWHDPPCTEQAEWLLKLANGCIDFKPGKEEIGPTKRVGSQERNANAHTRTVVARVLQGEG